VLVVVKVAPLVVVQALQRSLISGLIHEKSGQLVPAYGPEHGAAGVK
jgi:hypothetical protein